MTTQAKEPDVTKLLSMTDNVVIRERVYDGVRKTDAENREYGRFQKSIRDLAKAAAEFRNANMKGSE